MVRLNANRVIEEILRGYVHPFTCWSAFLPMAEFAINNSVHASTTHTPFFVNGLRHPRLPSLLGRGPDLSGEDHFEQPTRSVTRAHRAPTSRTTDTTRATLSST